MFPSVWDTNDDTTFITLATSGDGKYWQFAPDPVVLRTNTFGEWDGGCLFAYPDLVELPNGDFALPYTGYDVGHKYPRRNARRNTAYALWPKGRLAGVAAAEDGAFSTVAFIPPGSKVLLNAVVSRAGFVRVEACDMNGTVIAGREFAASVPLNGDCHRTPIVWRGEDTLGAAPGAPVCLPALTKWEEGLASWSIRVGARCPAGGSGGGTVSVQEREVRSEAMV